MIQLQSATLLRGSRQLLEQSSLTIHANEKVGLVGRNGCGKSSLFQLFLNDIQVDSGDYQIPKQWRISHMLQEIKDVDRSAIDFVIDGDKGLRKIQNKISILEQDDTADHTELANLYARIEELGGYTAEARAARLLNGLGFESSDIHKAVTAFSGGWRVRLALAQALMSPSDLLLLDEPTNHLDLSATIWLERWLKSYPGTLIIVSHDRDFLDQVVDVIVHIEHLKLNRYTGDYSSFESQRAERLLQQQQRFEKQQERIDQINNFVRRFRAKASKARQAQSRLKELERMEKVAPAHADSPFHFKIPCSDKIPQTLISLSQANLGYGEKVVVSNINVSLLENARIGLLGVNGAGKSTFLKSLAGELPLVNGDISEGSGLKIGYFAQHQLQSLDLNASPALHIQRISPKASEQAIRVFLGGFDFKNDRVFEPIGHFSGGEKARLTLAIIAWQKPNLLILDEPTNHLDMDMRHALTVALQDYQGAVIVVSHDRHLLRNTVEDLWLIANGKLDNYSGDLEDYQRWLSELTASTASTTKQASPNGTAPHANDRENKKSQRQQAAKNRGQLKPLRDKVKKFEKELERLQKKQEQINFELAEDSLYEAENKEKLNTLLLQQGEINNALNQCEEDWLLAQQALEELQ